MPANDVYTKSGTVPELKDEWRTPTPVFAFAERLFGPFNLDVAASQINHLAPVWFGHGGVREDALGVPWLHPEGEYTNAWMNPPYSATSKWMIKAFREALLGRASVTCLVGAATEVAWFHRCVYDLRASIVAGRPMLRQGVALLPLYRRIKFIDPTTNKPSKGSPPAGQMLVHFRRGLPPGDLFGGVDLPAVLDLLVDEFAVLDKQEAEEQAWVAALAGEGGDDAAATDA